MEDLLQSEYRVHEAVGNSMNRGVELLGNLTPNLTSQKLAFRLCMKLRFSDCGRQV